LQLIAEAQKTGGMAAFVDAEHALDPAMPKKLGVDVEQFAGLSAGLWRTGSGNSRGVSSLREQSTCWSWIQSRHWCPRPNLTEKWRTATWGFRRVLMSQALRKLTGIVSQIAHLPDFHQPNPGKNWRDVRQSRDYDWRSRA